jgi:uncharacterized protein
MNLSENLIPLVKPYYQSSEPAHDWAHIGRVINSARNIASKEKVEVDCVLAAVYCHDLINLPKDHPDRKNASTLAAEEATPLLYKAGFAREQIEVIRQAIIEHSFSRGLKPTTTVGEIVQDADRLDALGAIGILRCASINSQIGGSFYDPFDPFALERQLNDKQFMIDHYFAKLFRLPELMNTNGGREIAIQRVRYMEEFLEQLKSEIER